MNILNKLRKPSLSIILLSFVLLYSCNEQDNPEELQETKMDFKNFNPNLEMSFGNTFDFGKNDKASLDKLIEEYVGYLFTKQDEKDEVLCGFDISITETTTKIKPITIETMTASCPSGYENLGVCFSETCIKGKIPEYFEEHVDDFKGGTNIAFQLVDHFGGKRVCAISSPAVVDQ